MIAWSFEFTWTVYSLFILLNNSIISNYRQTRYIGFIFLRFFHNIKRLTPWKRGCSLGAYSESCSDRSRCIIISEKYRLVLNHRSVRGFWYVTVIDKFTHYIVRVKVLFSFVLYFLIKQGSIRFVSISQIRNSNYLSMIIVYIPCPSLAVRT